MKFSPQLCLAALATLAASSPLSKRSDAALELTLKATGNTAMEATLTNTGSVDLNILNAGTILDSKPVQKVALYSSDTTALPFQGVKTRVRTTGNITAGALTPLAAGASLTVAFDAAAVYDLSAGGTYTAVAAGTLPYAAADGTVLEAGVAYKSNAVELVVDGSEAASVAKAVDAASLEKRTDLRADCTGTKLTRVTTSLGYCADLASAAAADAETGSSTLSEYFGSTSSSVINTVSARLEAVADECGSTSSGATDLHCNDPFGYCTSNVLAYTLPALNYVVMCDLSFTALDNLSGTCHDQDVATTILHEFTHAPGVYSPGTDDNAYGYSASTALSTSAALLNADSYALYANAIYVGC